MDNINKYKQTNLNKENFWNEINMKYTEEMNQFSRWIDEYKLKIDWSQLFRLGGEIKFHDLPIALQIGIFIQFTYETDRFFNFMYDEFDDMEKFKVEIKRWFVNEHAHQREQEHNRTAGVVNSLEDDASENKD